MATGDPMCPHCGAYLFGSGHLCGAVPSIYKSPLEGWQSSNPNDPINLNRALVDALACADRLRRELASLRTRLSAMRAALEESTALNERFQPNAVQTAEHIQRVVLRARTLLDAEKPEAGRGAK